MSQGPAGAGAWLRGTDLAGWVLDLADRATDVDAVAPISGHMLAAVRAGRADVLSASDPGDARTGRPAGYAVAIGDDPAEVVVDPPARGRGAGTGLVRAAIERQGAVWAYGDLPAARAVAARLGLRRTRVLLQMRRPLPVGPGDLQTPPGVRIRTFEPGRDEAAFLRVNGRAFATHPEQGRLDLTGLREEMAQEWFDPGGFFLAISDPGDRLLGFHWTKIHRRDSGADGPSGADAIGEIYVLGVDPDAAVPGLGTVLAQIGLRHLGERGLPTAMLYVEAENARAVRLYERAGFTVHLTNVVYRP